MYRSTGRTLPVVGFVLLLALCVPVKNSSQSGVQIEMRDIRERVNRAEVKLDDIPSQLAKLSQRMDDSDRRDKEWRDWTFGIAGAILAAILTLLIENRFKMKP
jgi:hypothetical protein